MNPDATRNTERPGALDNLEQRSVEDLVRGIYHADQFISQAMEKALPQITAVAEQASLSLLNGHRIFYIGAGTSGRLGILDASECPPTFGVDHGRVLGIIAGGDGAIRKAVEHAEDDINQGWEDLKLHGAVPGDLVVGIAASGTTPYTVGALKQARENGLSTACITNNPNSPIIDVSDYPICIDSGPEFVTGSTRMKAGTTQKMALNMISTTAMIRLGRVRGNRMVDMQLTNDKLWDRGVKMICESLEVDESTALRLLKEYGSVRKVIDTYGNQ